MFEMKVLNQKVLTEVLDMKNVLEVIEEVYVLKSEGKTELFPMVFHEFNPGVADMDIKSGKLKDVDIYGLKLVSWFGENKEKNLPLLIGTTLIFDSKTGVPLALLNADHITGMRTGAAGAIGAKYLSRKDSRTLLMVGTGHIAKFEIAATLLSIDNIDTVKVYDPLSYKYAQEYVKNIESILEKEFSINKNIKFEAIECIETGVKSSDVIITATPSRKPLIKKEWVKPGTHLSCVGADMEGKQEIDENLFSSARVVVDDLNQAINVGETETAIKKEIITVDDIVSEIGEIVSGKIKGRTCDEDITIFDTTGMAIQDLITAKLALDLADKKQLGITIEL